MHFRDVPLAYNDDIKGAMHLRNVTIAYDDDTNKVGGYCCRTRKGEESKENMSNGERK